MLVSRPTDAWKNKCGFVFLASAVCFSGPVFFGRTDARFPGRSLGGQPAWRKKPSGLAQKAFPLWLPSCPDFSVGHLIFQTRRTQAPWRGDICFFLASAVCFSGPVSFGRTDARFPGWGSDGKLTIEFTFPKREQGAGTAPARGAAARAWLRARAARARRARSASRA